MRIEYLPLDDVAARAAPTNAKTHEVERIAGSMAQLGFFDPVVLDERTGLILAGHGRVEALQHLHAADPDDPPANIDIDTEHATVAEADEPVRTFVQWRVPVVHGWASADDAHAEAARLAANRLGERGGWDAEKLLAAVAPLEQGDLLWAAGWDTTDLDALVAAAGDAADLVDVPDDAAAYSEAADPPDPTDSTPGAGTAPARRAQGLREAYLVMTLDQFEEYTALVKRYRAWKALSTDEPVAVALIDALHEALGDHSEPLAVQP